MSVWGGWMGMWGRWMGVWGGWMGVWGRWMKPWLPPSGVCKACGYDSASPSGAQGH